jgi:low temperature requirement protein LtrA
VTTLELFFDLVFVFTLTQLTALLEEDLSPAGAGRAFLVFGVLWWMYGGYAWMTNQVAPRRPVQQILLLVGMAGFLVAAVSVPHAFDGTGVEFGLGYLVVVCVHLALFSQSTGQHGTLRLAPFNLASALLVVAAGFVDSPLKYALWIGAFGLQVVTPFLNVAPLFELNAAHFVERHGLLMIVALGETVIAIGLGVDSAHVTASVLASVVLALALPAALWWSYFSGDDEAAEHELSRAEPPRRAVLAIRAYFYAHIPMLLGIVVTAAGIHIAIAHPGEAMDLGGALALAGGIALFFLGEVEFRRVLRVGPFVPRLVTAGLALATVPLGLTLPAVIQLVALIAVVVAVLVSERAHPSAVTARS